MRRKKHTLPEGSRAHGISAEHLAYGEGAAMLFCYCTRIMHISWIQMIISRIF
jgi:hypothetical protein